MSDTKKCRVCGCTETTACDTNSGPCHWAEPDLCSGCVRVPRELTLGMADLEALESLPPIPVALDGVSAFFLMSALQLACRHPGLKGPVHETVYDFARGLQERVSLSPSLAAMCDAGWNPDADVPNEKPSGLILPGDPQFAL